MLQSLITDKPMALIYRAITTQATEASQIKPKGESNILLPE